MKAILNVSPSSSVLIGLALLTFIIYSFYKSVALRAILPPGPRGFPLVGNLFDISPRMWESFTEWKKKYGPIVYVDLAGQSMVVLNTHKVATDLLDKRASIYSDRPRLIVASEIMSRGLILGFMRSNDVWKRVRKGSHEALNNQMARSYRPFEQIESYLLAESLLKQPRLLKEHLRRSTTSFIMSVVYGTKPLVDSEDETMLRLERFLQRSLRAGSGYHWVEYFHWMEHLPRWMAKWRRDAEAWFHKDSAMFKSFYDQVLERRASGDDRPCVVSNLVEEQTKKNLSDLESIWLAGTMYAAGSDLSAATMQWFILALLVYPETQAAAHAELDKVVGRMRMPTFDDYDHLPYIRAMVKELLRWRPVAPTGVPHCSIQDDWYEGYFIPKGTMLVSNIWAMNHDETIYGPDAEHFNPRRYLNDKGELRASIPDTKDEGHVTYGFGRRICVGRHVANQNLFIQLASMLWACNFQPDKDAYGTPIIPDVKDCLTDMTMKCKPFSCDISPRFAEVSEILEESIKTNHYGQL